MNSAIIAAAGSGTRFGSDIPKQFYILGGKPLIAHTISRFEECSSIDEIIIVVANEHITQVEKIVSENSFSKVTRIAVGGDSRAKSVANGFAVVSKNSEIVAVHDGARPFVAVEEITATIEKAKAAGAACLVAAVTDTIKEIADQTIVKTIDRTKLRRALTPQAFQYSILERALSGPSGEDITDECSLVERLGLRAAFIEGSPRNIKITTPDDILIAEAFLADHVK